MCSRFDDAPAIKNVHMGFKVKAIRTQVREERSEFSMNTAHGTLSSAREKGQVDRVLGH